MVPPLIPCLLLYRKHQMYIMFQLLCAQDPFRNIKQINKLISSIIIVTLFNELKSHLHNQAIWLSVATLLVANFIRGII